MVPLLVDDPGTAKRRDLTLTFHSSLRLQGFYVLGIVAEIPGVDGAMTSHEH